jgi:hypothetical protein
LTSPLRLGASGQTAINAIDSLNQLTDAYGAVKEHNIRPPVVAEDL